MTSKNVPKTSSQRAFATRFALPPVRSRVSESPKMPHFGPILAHLGGHVGPLCGQKREKGQKSQNAQKYCNLQGRLYTRGGRRRVGGSRNNLRLPPKALRAAHGLVAGARISGLTPHSRAPAQGGDGRNRSQVLGKR